MKGHNAHVFVSRGQLIAMAIGCADHAECATQNVGI